MGTINTVIDSNPHGDKGAYQIDSLKQKTLNELKNDLDNLQDKFFLPESEKQKQRVRLEAEIDILESELEYKRDKYSELY